MGDCHLDDLLDILDQDDDFEETVPGTETMPNRPKNDENDKSKEISVPPQQADPEKEALKRKLQEMEEQMKMIKSQLGTGQTPDEGASKTITEVDMFSSNSAVDNKHLRSPVKVSDMTLQTFTF